MSTCDAPLAYDPDNILLSEEDSIVDFLSDQAVGNTGVINERANPPLEESIDVDI